VTREVVTTEVIELVAAGSLKEHGISGPPTYPGIQSAGFPNLFMVGGAQSATQSIPRATERQVDRVTDLITWMQEHGMAFDETTRAGEWIDHVHSGSVSSLLEKAESWTFDSDGPRSARAYRLYAGRWPQYREKIGDVERDGYRGCTFRSHDGNN
jgi:hypothetical protein